MLKLVLFSCKLFFAMILMKDWRDDVKLWSAVSLFCASLFETTEWLQGAVLPYALSNDWPLLARAVTDGYPILFFIQETGIPYAFLLAAIAYNGSFAKRHLGWIALALLLFPALSLLTVRHGLLQLDHPLFIVLATVYLLIAIALMAAEAPRKRGARPRNRKIAEALIMIPNMAALLVFHYAGKLVQSWSHWENAVLAVVAATFALFLLVISRTGMLGIKLRLERQVAAHTFQSVTAGTALLNHSIKNRLTNIDLLAERILDQPAAAGQTKVKEDVALIHAETGQLLEMVRRIQHRTEAIVLNEQLCSLHEIAQAAVSACALYRSDKQPQLLLEVKGDLAIRGDRVHMQEMLVNLLHNALDALPERGGYVRVTAERTRRGVAMEIRDNGAGIPADQLRKVLEPFYSTKDPEANFGLGLTYCSLVADKHNGKLQVNSTPGEGTAVRIMLPAKRVTSGALAK